MWGALTWAWCPTATKGSWDSKVAPKVAYIYGGLRPPIISNRVLEIFEGGRPPLIAFALQQTSDPVRVKVTNS